MIKQEIKELTRGAVHQQKMLKTEAALDAWHRAVEVGHEKVFWQTLAETNPALATVFVEDLYYQGLHNDRLNPQGSTLYYGFAKEIIDTNLGESDE